MPRYIGYTPTPSADTAFTGGSKSVATLLSIAENIRKGNTGTATGLWSVQDVASFKRTQQWPGSGTTAEISPTNQGVQLTVNSNLLHNYDYVRKQGDQTLSSFNSGDWFPGTENGSIVVVNGNMTINGGVTFQPSNNKKFIFLYVYGNFILNGSVSMTHRGPNHGGQNEGEILITTGTYSSVTDPKIPTGGGGVAGNQGATGDGGQSCCNSNSWGQPGTSFTGGPGGAGGGDGQSATRPQVQGGRGGDASGFTGGVRGYGGGAGNPGGSGRSEQSGPGSTGIGGVCIIYCTGTFSGNGSITASGNTGGYGRNIHGASSGGGSVTVMCNTNSFTGSVSADAGAAATGGDPGTGPRGQSGTARILTGASAP